MSNKSEQIKALKHYLQHTSTNCGSWNSVNEMLTEIAVGRKLPTDEQTQKEFLGWLAKQPELAQKYIVGDKYFYEYKTGRYQPPPLWVQHTEHWINLKTGREVRSDNSGIRKQPANYKREVKALVIKYSSNL